MNKILFAFALVLSFPAYAEEVPPTLRERAEDFWLQVVKTTYTLGYSNVLKIDVFKLPNEPTTLTEPSGMRFTNTRTRHLGLSPIEPQIVDSNQRDMLKEWGYDDLGYLLTGVAKITETGTHGFYFAINSTHQGGQLGYSFVFNGELIQSGIVSPPARVQMETQQDLLAGEYPIHIWIAADGMPLRSWVATMSYKAPDSMFPTSIPNDLLHEQK